MGSGTSNLSLFIAGNRVNGCTKSGRASKPNLDKYQMPVTINHDQVYFADTALVISMEQPQASVA
jgi:hypothetical protein